MGTGDVIATAGLVILIVGLFFAARQLALVREQMTRQYEWSAKMQALSYSLAQNANLRSARTKIDQAFGDLLAAKEPLSMSRIEEVISADRSVQTDLRYVLAHWGNLVLAIKAGVCDEAVAREMLGATVVMHVRALRNYIDDRRNLDPSYYEYLLDLSHRWELAIQRNEQPAWKDFRTSRISKNTDQASLG